MTPRVPRVAQSSFKIFPSIDKFWSNGATENACMICGKKRNTVRTQESTDTCTTDYRNQREKEIKAQRLQGAEPSSSLATLLMSLETEPEELREQTIHTQAGASAPCCFPKSMGQSLNVLLSPRAHQDHPDLDWSRTFNSQVHTLFQNQGRPCSIPDMKQ